MIRAKFLCKKHSIQLSGHPQWVGALDEVYVPSMSMMWCPANDAKFMDRDHCDETNWRAELHSKI